MDCGCNCFGIAASSRKPVKRYNLLMPALFGSKPPPASGDLDASVLRRIKKVVEYCEKNPHRLPKVWRTFLGGRPLGSAANSASRSGVSLAVIATRNILVGI
jgi:hypothetical protein